MIDPELLFHFKFAETGMMGLSGGADCMILTWFV